MKIYALLAAVVFVLGCTSTPPLDTGQQAAEQPAETQDILPIAPEVPDCGLDIDMISPQTDEIISSGFRVEWELINVGDNDFTNKEVDFTIYMKSESGSSTNVRSIKRFYGSVYKEDITFLTALPDGRYSIGVRGSAEGCNIAPVEVPVTLI